MRALTWSNLPLLLLLVAAVLAAFGVAHILLTKRDHPAASLGWVVIVTLLPLTGLIIYGLFGINRVERRARQLRPALTPPPEPPSYFGHINEHLYPLAELGRRVGNRALTHNHSIRALQNGDQAYPEMLDAIAGAERQVWLSTYIFDTDRAGRQFIDALAGAAGRGVDTRVLIDGVGEYYSRPRAGRLLRRRRVAVARFLPVRLIPTNIYMNLRNHRKMLLIDGRQVFFGGMNIGDRHVVAAGRRIARDMQFAIRGQVLEQFAELFARDWWFVTGHWPDMPLAEQYGEPARDRQLLARVIADGPDKDLDRLRLLILGAIRAARNRIVLMTPYFIPADEIISALVSAALSGVRIDVLLPERSNVVVADWAGRAVWHRLLEAGIHIHLQPPPFMHGKWLLADGEYALLGSANIDERSLRLNYELGVEVYDREFVSELVQQSNVMIAASRRVDPGAVENWPLPVRLRNAATWLAAPYL